MSYCFHNATDLPNIVIEIYDDGICLSKSGSQSVSVVRMRLENFMKHSLAWHDVAIAPLVQNIQNLSSSEMADHRQLVFQ